MCDAPLLAIVVCKHLCYCYEECTPISNPLCHLSFTISLCKNRCNDLDLAVHLLQPRFTVKRIRAANDINSFESIVCIYREGTWRILI